MSLENTRLVVEQFLSKDKDSVLSIRGDWGVGKTHLWNDTIKKYAAGSVEGSSNARYKRYSYVSLFGVDGINDLKDQIFQKTVDTKSISIPPSVDSVIKNITDAFIDKEKVKYWWGKRRRTLGWGKSLLENVPYIGKSAGLISGVAFFSVRNTLICLDDLERKGKNLRMEDIFGLISELKEEHKCSVVILMNEDASPNDVAKPYAMFRDKVVDMEVKFSPEPQDCIELIVPASNPYREFIAQSAGQLHITNMRIVGRCVDLLSDLGSVLNNHESEVVAEVVRLLVLFCWCWFHRRDGVPELESVIEAVRKPYEPIFKKQDDLTLEQKILRDVMLRYGYIYNVSLSDILADYIRYGYCDRTMLQCALNKLDNEAVVKRGKTSLASIFDRIYLNQFGDNEEEVVGDFYKIMEEHKGKFSGRELDNIVYILRELKRNGDVEKIVDMYIKYNKNDVGALSEDELRLGDSTRDSYVVRRFREEFASSDEDRRSIFEVALNMTATRTFIGNDIAFLARHSVDDYYEMFRAIRHDDLIRVISGLLDLGRVQDAPPEWSAISNNLSEALRRISKQSKIDRLRIKAIGIELDDADTQPDE